MQTSARYYEVLGSARLGASAVRRDCTVCSMLSSSRTQPALMHQVRSAEVVKRAHYLHHLTDSMPCIGIWREHVVCAGLL